jgi:hypothetical protein
MDSYRASILNLTSECRHDGGTRNGYDDGGNDDDDGDDKP